MSDPNSSQESIPVSHRECTETVKEFKESQGEILKKLDVVTKALTGNEDGTVKGVNARLDLIDQKQDTLSLDVAHIKKEQESMKKSQSKLYTEVAAIKGSSVGESSGAKIKKAALIGGLGAGGGGIVLLLTYLVQLAVELLKSKN